MRSLLEDVRLGVRLLLKRPGFAAIAIVTLGLGIGATSSVYTFVDALLLRPLEFREPDRLVQVWDSNDRAGWEYANVSPADLPDWAEAESLEGLALYHPDVRTLTGAGEPRSVQAIVATANLLPLLGVEPIAGRTFTEAEASPGGAPVALVTESFVTEQFGGEPGAALGQVLTLDGTPTEVVGVVPGSLRSRFGDRQLWLPCTIDLTTHHRGWRYAYMMGRLAPGATIEQADAELGAISLAVNERFPQGKAGWRAKAQPLMAAFIGDDLRDRLFTIGAAVVLVFLIACANVACLLFTQAVARQKEMAIRSAVGAQRARLVRQLLTEGLVLAIFGAGLGVILATWGVDWLKATLQDTLPRLHEVTVDGRVLAFSAAAAIVATLVFALAPAVLGSRSALSALLSDGMRSSSSGVSTRVWRDVIVGGQVALALALVTCAGLMLRSYWKLVQVDPGFDPRGVLTFNLPNPPWTPDSGTTPWEYHQGVMQRLSGMPGVKRAAVTTNLPLASGGAVVFRPKHWEPETPGEIQYVGHRVVSPGYFEAMGIPLLAGRAFEESDQIVSGQQPELVLVVNKTLADTYWPGEDVVGKHVNISEPMENEPDFRIVGVVSDVRHQGLSEEPQPEIFRAYAQTPILGSALTYVLRAEAEDPLVLADSARDAIWAENPDQPVDDVLSMASVVERSTEGRGIHATLLSAIAGLALVLSGIGLYGVMAHAVSQRTAEIGIRMALGARGLSVIGLVMRRAVVLTVAGLSVGTAAAVVLASQSPLARQLHRVTATDPPTHLGVVAVLLLVSMVASFVPARRAVSIEPMEAMRAGS